MRRRVIVAEKIQPKYAEDGFEWVERYLETWAHFMRFPGLKLGAPSRTSGFMSDCTGGYRDPEDVSEVAGYDRAIQVIDATLDDCSPAESCAVMHIHLHAVFRFREPVMKIYLSARQKIGNRLRAYAFF